MQVHPVPLMATAVRPAGKVSLTLTVPLDDALPMFVMTIEYVCPFCPCVKLPEWVLVIVRSEETMSIEAVAVFPAPPFVDATFPVVFT